MDVEFTMPSRWRRLRALLLVAVAGLAAVALAACGSSSKSSNSSTGSASSGGSTNASASTGGSKGKLLWVQPLRNNPVHRIMQGGFLSECKRLGYQCEIVGSETLDMPATAPLADAVLSKGGIKGMGVYAYDPSTYPFIARWGRDHPIVSWHIPVRQGDAPGLKATTGCVPTDYARNAAIAIGRQIGGKGTVAVTEGSFNTVENLVAKTFTDTMKAQYPNVKVLKPQEEGFDAPAAKAKAVSILQSDPSINAAFSTTGGGPVTWAGAQQQSGKRLTIIGMDYVRQNLDLVSSGQVFAVVGQPLFQEGARTADLLDELASGKTVSYENPLPAAIITRADVPRYTSLLDEADAATKGL
ncbi:MAG: ABC-type sugar transport system periplasmic component-like protein [Conexibacter sp.]|jgi:ribose transport system substrate-binding protein|nr:ABC-type sugar transport system periplasmic component-like protein [Conexibacter sp.]